MNPRDIRYTIRWANNGKNLDYTRDALHQANQMTYEIERLEKKVAELTDKLDRRHVVDYPGPDRRER